MPASCSDGGAISPDLSRPSVVSDGAMGRVSEQRICSTEQARSQLATTACASVRPECRRRSQRRHAQAPRQTQTIAPSAPSRSTRLLAMSEPTFADVDALVGPATPHFAYQLRARVRELVIDLPEGHPGSRVRGREDRAARRPRLRLLEGGRQPPRAADAAGLGRLPSSAPADEPLPRA